VRVREERQALAKAPKPKAAKPAPAQPAEPATNGAAKRRTKDIEAAIERAEAELQRLEAELADPQSWNDPRSAEKSTRRHAQARRMLDDLYAEWEAVAS
jgi:ATP-binding cassette subfamily F protein 3